MAMTGTDEPAVDGGTSSVDKIENQTECGEDVANDVPHNGSTIENTKDNPGESSNETPDFLTNASVTQADEHQQDSSVQFTDSVGIAEPAPDAPASNASASDAPAADTSASNAPVSDATAAVTPVSNTTTSNAAESTPPSASDDSTAISSEAQAEHPSITDSTNQGTVGGSDAKPDPVKSALVSKVLKKAREAAEGDQRSTGSTAYSGDQRSTGSTKSSDQRATGSDQKSTGATRLPDQRSTGATRFNDQSTTGATRFTDQKSTGATPRISDQRSTGSTQGYNDISTTGTFKSLIGRPPLDGSAKAPGESDVESDEAAPERSRKSLTATIETEAKKSKVSLFEKVISKHPIVVGSIAFCVFVVPIYAFIVNSQSPAQRAEYKQSWGKDVKIIASKLGKPGQYKGHKVAFYVNRADVYMKSADYVSAISDLKIARQIDIAKADDYNLKLSSCYLAIKDYKNAAEVSGEVLKDDPSNIDALLQHGQASSLFGNKLTALDDYFKAVKLDTSNPKVFIGRGDYYVAEKQPGSAAVDYKHALDLAPSLAEAKQKLAACTVVVAPRASSSSSRDAGPSSAKLSPAAMKILAEADFATLRTKGYEALKKGDNLFAIAALRRAVSLNPNEAMVRQYLAYAFLANGDYEAAVEQFNAWDKIAILKISEKLAFAGRLPPDNCQSAAALYTELIEQHAADGQALISIANACKARGYQAQFESAVEAGLKVGTPAEVAQLNSIKVVEKAEEKASKAKAILAQ
jgi:tetratricopeptide (TPR) repeat protein